jgi:cellulose synthase/poly-beta-1,6-N-acetylglucosamine synthase-like glycosyltransferase
MQVPEYLRAFLFGRLGFNSLGGNLIVSGAFGIFRKDRLIEIGGFNTSSVAEDLDLCVRLHEHLLEKKIPYSVPFVPDPIAWTEAPEDLATLASQRERWHRGLVSTVWQHRHLIFNPRYRRVGFITFPFYVFGEMFAPLIEAFGILVTSVGLWFGIVEWRMALLFLAACWGYGLLLTLASVVLEEVTFRCYPRLRDFFLMIFFAMLEPFGYRQLTVIWRLRSFWSAWRGSKKWGAMKRRGFATAGT